MATVTSKGQVTLPKAVRDALGIAPGDRIRFRVERERAVVEKAGDFLELAGSVPVPERLRGADWDEIRADAHRSWADDAEAPGRA